MTGMLGTIRRKKYYQGGYYNYDVRVPARWAEDNIKNGRNHVQVVEKDNGELVVTAHTDDEVKEMKAGR
jgi:hypothetical protein